jgi:hypothetical protein
VSVRTGQSITKVFTTRVFATGVATNADSTPTGTLYVNGTADAASVTVTNVATGIYKAAVTMPTLAVGDIVDLRIAATVSSVSDTEVIWSDTKDIAADSSGKVPATIAAGDLATDSITAAALKADAVTEIQNGLMTSVGYTAPDNATISTIAGNIGTAGAGLTAIGDIRLANLDAAVSTRLATAGYTAPDNASASSAASSASTAATQTTAANIRAAVGMSAADLDTQIDALPTNDELTAAIAGLLTTQMAEAYAVDGTAPTLAQCLFLIQQSLHEFSISGTTRTVKKLDGSTTAAVFTLDSATAPTSTTRTT